MKASTWIRPALLLIALAAAPRPTEAQNVRLTFQLIEADGFEGMDPAIADVVEELREVFRFRGYRLLDTSILRATLIEGRQTPAQQRLDLGDMGVFNLRAFVEGLQAPGTFRVFVNIIDQFDQNVMDASVTPRPGQTVVLGSARPNGAAGALILVMTAQLD